MNTGGVGDVIATKIVTGVIVTIGGVEMGINPYFLIAASVGALCAQAMLPTVDEIDFNLIRKAVVWLTIGVMLGTFGARLCVEMVQSLLPFSQKVEVQTLGVLFAFLISLFAEPIYNRVKKYAESGAIK